MIHLGDIKRISGLSIEPVDCVTGGSPCQDLSVAGKRAGLSGDRSGLFWEQIRVICELREATGGHSPRFMVWENVPGALNSNNGIGGFPLCWPGRTAWASEIDEFCIAVTKNRFSGGKGKA